MNTISKIRIAAATESAANTVYFAVQVAMVFAAGVSVTAVCKALLDALSV